jgi:hypothetical protein
MFPILVSEVSSGGFFSNKGRGEFRIMMVAATIDKAMSPIPIFCLGVNLMNSTRSWLATDVGVDSSLSWRHI